MARSEPPRLAWPGRYSDGRTAAFYRVDARIGEDGAVVEMWPRDEVRLVDGPDAGGAIRLGRKGSDARLSVEDRDALRALEMRCDALQKGLAEESSWRVIALWSGSRALNVFIDTISIMYGLGGKRGIIRTRILSFTLYVAAEIGRAHV